MGPRDSTQEASEWKTLPKIKLIAYSSHLNIICINLHVMYGTALGVLCCFALLFV